MTTVVTGKPFLQAFQQPLTGAPPFWLMRQAGRYLPEYRNLRAQAPDFLSFCYSPDLTTEAALQPLRRYGMSAAILFSDILVVPDALGCGVTFVEGKGPQLEPVRRAQDLEALSIDAVSDHLAPVYDAVRQLKKNLPPEVALIGFAGAPWTIAIYMVEGQGGTDGSTARKWAYSDPAGFARLIDLVVDATTVHLTRQIESGAEALQIFDSWAGLLSEAQFRRWVIEPTAEIVRRVRAVDPTIPIIGFPRGAGVLCLDYAHKTGIDGISLDAGVPLDWAVHELQSRVLVQGNLDNIALVAGGSALGEETQRILQTLSGGRFVFNLSHGVLPQTPPDHVAVLAEQVRGWRGEVPPR